MTNSTLSWKNVAVVGATGAVGKEMIGCLFGSEEFPFDSLKLYASARSAGVDMQVPRFGSITVEEFSVDAVVASGCKIVFLAVSGTFSEEVTPSLVQHGCIVIDNSSAFRYVDSVPLVVPEINLGVVKSLEAGMVIANPNCTTAILAMVLYPIYVKFGVKTVIASTYQAASGAGEPGMQELESAIAAAAAKTEFTPHVFSHNLCGNVIPCIDQVLENQYTKEEMKMAWETRKIFGNSDIAISCTAVRVPTMRAHCISASIQLDRPATPTSIRELLRSAPGVDVKDDPVNKVYPVPASATGKANVEVGRIRQSLVWGESGIDLFVSGDQLLRGAALNAVRIAKLLVARV